jgi:hypothetical protein
MSKVVPIERGKFLGDYISHQKASRHLEQLFVFGVLTTIVVPQVVYCAIGGPVTAWVFVISAQAGVIIGLVKYIWPPAAPMSVAGGQTEPIFQGNHLKRRRLS